MPGSDESLSERSSDKAKAILTAGSADRRYGLSAEAGRCPLTGLPDRQAFVLALASAVLDAGRSDRGPVVMCLRVKGLPELERRLGREARDSALRIFAERIRDTVRPSTLVARNNADEFAVLAPKGDSVVATEERVERILAALNCPFELSGERLTLESAIGVARFPESGRESEVLYLNANAALRIALEQNAAYRFWYEGLGESAQERQSIEKELVEAIEHDQLELHFQPMLDANSGEVRGMEALARWRRPGFGWVSPLEFFAVAKDCGVLDELEEWVIRRAASVHANWLRRGISRGRLAINCVPSFLARPNFEEKVLSILDMQGLDGNAVEFEVEQESLIPGAKIRLESLESLRASGIRITIDDFDQLSLPADRLARLPVDRLKLASSCLPGRERETAGPEGLRDLIERAEGLNIEVSAKGVEDASQRAFLLESSCRTMQGFLFGRPMTPLDAAVLLRRGFVEL